MDLKNLPESEFKIIIGDNDFENHNQDANMIPYEGSNGFWSKCEYDADSNNCPVPPLNNKDIKFIQRIISMVKNWK